MGPFLTSGLLAQCGSGHLWKDSHAKGAPNSAFQIYFQKEENKRLFIAVKLSMFNLNGFNIPKLGIA